MTEKSAESQQSYEMVSIHPADPPSGAAGSNWYGYVIAFGGLNNIRGFRQGKLSVVTDEVEELVAQLNQKRRGKYGRVHLIPTPKKTAPNKKAN